MVILGRVKDYCKKNTSLLIIAFAYAVLLLSIIDWGIPNIHHPYTYHMDEWHQLQAVKSTFKNLTPNSEGAAHGTVFHFFLTGVYLVPFYLLGIIDPFVLKSGLYNMPVWTRFFEILRLNTLLYGILSLVVLNEIVKRYFKINPTMTLVFFTFTPIWISLSNYFKYDIALTFWILAAVYFLLRFGSNPTLRNYIYAGVFCALTLAVKVSAVVFLPIYLFSFFYFTSPKKRNYRHIVIGFLVFLFVFLLFGIPDVLLGKADYNDFLSANLIDSPRSTANYILDYSPWWMHITRVVMPIDFGHVFFVIFFISIVYWSIVLIKGGFNSAKNEFFILFCLIIFIISVWQLKIGANGNRLLVLLPFFAILAGTFFSRLFTSISVKSKKILFVMVGIFVIFQFLESTAIIYVKNRVDVRQSSSAWLVNNIHKGSLIGIENIPIYQLLPDVVLKEFYEKQDNPKLTTNFQYTVIGAATRDLPEIVIITNKELESQYMKKSAKKDLVNRLEQENYTIKQEFKPPQILYFIMKNEIRMFTSGLVPIPTITIYVKG